MQNDECRQGMTRAEFSVGWTLLLTQPWGWRYNKLENGKPTAEAIVQLDFYYAKLSWAHPDAWRHVAELYAQGNEWPSVTDLKRALQQINANFVTALPAPTDELVSMPDEVRTMLDRIIKSKSMED